MMRRHAVLRPLFCLGVLMPLTVGVLSGCASPPSGAIGLQGTSTSMERPWMDRTLTLPSGATLKVPVEWTTTAATDGVILLDPEKLVRIDLVEVDATGGMSGAIAKAWSRRYPSFNRQELAASDSPGREGWELFRWSRYKTSPEESRRVSAFGARKGPLAAVVLVDGPLATVQRRASQVAIVHDSLRPAGYVRETYRGRAPRPLDAARVAELKAFIERMRNAADVPGMSVVVFDANATLIEEGFGVRERGRPEPVTGDSLFMIASNTKPLTTLLLARLVDEGRFGWETPVTRLDPRFRTGGPGRHPTDPGEAPHLRMYRPAQTGLRVALYVRPLVGAGAARRAGDHEAYYQVRRAVPVQ